MSMSNPEFDARLARIASGKGSSKATLYVGMDEVYHVSYSDRGKPVGASASNSGALYPVVALLALAVGILAYAVSTWLRFRMMGISSGTGDPATEMAVQVGSAFVTALIIGMVLGFRSRQMLVMMAIGAISATALFHNAVHIYPDQFAEIYSPEWVEVVTASTRANSVMWMGQSFTF